MYAVMFIAAMGFAMPCWAASIGEPITISVTATVNNAAVMEARRVEGQIEAVLNGEPVAYTEIVEEDGTVTLLVTGE